MVLYWIVYKSYIFLSILSVVSYTTCPVRSVARHVESTHVRPGVGVAVWFFGRRVIVILIGRSHKLGKIAGGSMGFMVSNCFAKIDVYIIHGIRKVIFAFSYCLFFPSSFEVTPKKTQNVWRRCSSFGRRQWIRYVQGRFRRRRCPKSRLPLHRRKTPSSGRLI